MQWSVFQKYALRLCIWQLTGAYNHSDCYIFDEPRSCKTISKDYEHFPVQINPDFSLFSTRFLYFILSETGACQTF